jgi:protease-4
MMREESDNVAPAGEDGGQDSRCRQCPLGLVPATVWKRLLRPPFRSRHPVIFYGALVFVLLLVLVAVARRTADGIAGGDALGFVEIKGPILDVSDSLAWIADLERDDGVKGVLVRMDSPGGGAAASQELHGALARLAKRKPVAVSMGSVAASGGLMVSMAGERVFANASTVTGSIGVRMDIPQLWGLMDKLGVGQQTLVTGPYKDAGSYMRPLSDAEREYYQGVISDMHEQFVELVAKGRKLPLPAVRELADGKIFTGRAALGYGLVDELGDELEARRWLAAKTGVPEGRKLRRMPDGRYWLARRLLTWFGGEIAAVARDAGSPEGGFPFFQYR